MSFVYILISRWFICCGLLLILASCRTVIILEYDQNEITNEKFLRHNDLSHEVASIVDPIVKTRYSHGVMVGIYLPDGTRQYYGYGAAGESYKTDPPNSKTLFAVGSVSKGFIAGLMTLLVREGILSWEQTLDEALPGNSFSPSVKKITLQQLARHISGLPKQPNDLNMFNSLARYTLTGKNLYVHLDQNYIFNYLSTFEVPENPTLTYSNIGYGLLAHVIERKTGRAVIDLISEKILKPLALNHTGYSVEKLPGFETKAIGHAGDQPAFLSRGTAVPDWDFGPFLTSSAGIYTTAEDMLSFAVAHLGIEKTVLHQCFNENISLENSSMAVTYPFPQIQWVTDQVENQKITYQLGLTSGYSSYVGIDKEKKIAVVVLQNSFNWTEKMGHRLLHRLSNHYSKK